MLIKSFSLIKPSLPIMWSALLLTLLHSACLAAKDTSYNVGLTDAIDVATRNSETAHGFRVGGEVSRSVIGDAVGGHPAQRLTRMVKGHSSWLSYRIKTVPYQPTTVEIEEMYGRDRDVRGYLLLADDKKVYLRTFQGCGAGSVHYFVQLPTTCQKSVTLKFINQLDTPFCISRIWAYSNFRRYFDSSRMAVPYYLAPTIWLSYTNFGADHRQLRQIKDSLGTHPHVKPAWTTWIPYARLNDHEIDERIDYILRLANDLAMPVQISFDSWWANTPSGPDGKGGLWTDVQYQQVVYNQTKRQYQLSVPNQWSNTPWLTVNHPDLNAFKTRRLQTAMTHLRHHYQILLAEGKQNLILALNMDNEPVYWATGNAGLGSDIIQADFNLETVKAARLDGIALDPTDGLSKPEQHWLARNLLRYNMMIAEAMRTGLGLDANVVRGPGVRVANDFLRNNIYTQAMVANAALQYPLLDASYPFWETAAPANARIGGEWNSNSLREIEAVLHQLPFGRNAAVNAECGNNAADMLGVKPGYALAQRYFALYNYPLDKMDVASSEIHDLTQPFPAFEYLPVLREDYFRDENWKQRVFTSKGLQNGIIGNTTAMAIYPASNTEPGHLTYKLDAPHGTFDTGLVLEFSGRAFVYRKQDKKVNIRVLAGPQADAGSMQELRRVFDTGDINAVHRVDLSAVARGQKTIYVLLELNAPGLPADVLSWCAIYHVRFTLPWASSVKQGLPPQDESLATVRQQNLVVSWRRDAELAIDEISNQMNRRMINDPTRRTQHDPYTTSRLAAAQSAYARGSYADAYHLANEGQSILLPATYHVQANGQLKPYPLRLVSQQPVTCTVQQWSKDMILFDLDSPIATAVQIKIDKLTPGQPYTLETIQTGGHSRWALRRKNSRDGGTKLIADQAGAVTWHSTIEPVNHIETAERDARVAQEVKISPQTIEGTVSEFGQLTPFTMPFIVVDTDNKRHVIDLNAPLHLSSGNTTMKATPLGAVKITPGHKVRLRFDAKTGRVFELWQLS